MKGSSARHVLCDAQHGHGLKAEGSLHEQQAHAHALRLSHAYVRIQDADEVSAEEEELGGEGKTSLCARAIP
ncbi:MAG: hypothetical protein HYZ50_22580 [Deltaproteobacteria bacterium]|nr:hypothetical protein [Deltaproteobacteria bacterium]